MASGCAPLRVGAQPPETEGDQTYGKAKPIVSYDTAEGRALNCRVDEAKGTIKEVTGKLVGDKTLEAKGNIQKNLGKVQAKVGDIKQDVKDSVKK